MDGGDILSRQLTYPNQDGGQIKRSLI